MRVENTDIADIDNPTDDKTDEVVKSGDLSVTATPSTDRKIIVGENGWVSDTDTLTFKTSENVEITKITLERYGFSDWSKVVSWVRLEDADGNVIADSKWLNSKDEVTLSIKKDYRKVDGTYTATIVVETTDGSKEYAGGTMWFKVTDVQSTAKNLNVDNYKPYNYDLVVYEGTKVELSRFGNDKDYNYEPNTMYEVARFRLKANNSAIIVNGFTLTNKADKKIDLQKYLDKVEVTANGEKVSVKYSTNKDDQLVITLSNEYELAAKKAVSFVVNASLAEFEAYGDGVKFELATNDLKALEKKTETRVTVEKATGEWAKHIFRGGKIKLANTRLGTVEASAGSIGVVVAEWDVTVGESVKMADFTVFANKPGVNSMIVSVAGEEYEVSAPNFLKVADEVIYNPGDIILWANWDIWYIATERWDRSKVTKKLPGLPFTFSKVVIEKSGKLQFKVELDQEIDKSVKEIGFTLSGNKTSFDKAAFSGAQYEELRNEYVNAEKDVSGSISFSTLKVQAASASLENTMSKSKAVEFITDRTDRKVVFSGTYTAEKWAVLLNSFWIERTSADGKLDSDITFYVTIDNEEIGSVDTFKDGKTAIERFSDINVKKDQVVDVKVEAEVSSDAAEVSNVVYELYLDGEDAEGNQAGNGSDAMAKISVKSSGSVVIPASNKKGNTVVLRNSGETIAYFTVKPSNGNEGIYLDTLKLEIEGKVDGNDVAAKDLTVKVDGKKVDVDNEKDGIVYKPNKELPSEWVVVEVILKGEGNGKFSVTATANDVSKVYNMEFVDAIVNVESQTNNWAFTTYSLRVDTYDDTVSVDNLAFYVGNKLVAEATDVTTWDEMDADNTEANEGSISKIVINGKEFTKKEYKNFFVTDKWESLRVFPNK